MAIVIGIEHYELVIVHEAVDSAEITDEIAKLGRAETVMYDRRL